MNAPLNVDLGRPGLAALGALALVIDAAQATGALGRRSMATLLERLGAASPNETQDLIRRVEALSRAMRRLEESKQP